jgi:hypothetical protein
MKKSKCCGAEVEEIDEYFGDNNLFKRHYCKNCGKPCEVIEEETTLDTFIDIKKWFETNYLDGDKIQDGQMLSSEECFDAIKSSLEAQRQAIDKEWRGRIEVIEKECTNGNILNEYSWNKLKKQLLK